MIRNEFTKKLSFYLLCIEVCVHLKRRDVNNCFTSNVGSGALRPLYHLTSGAFRSRERVNDKVTTTKLPTRKLIRGTVIKAGEVNSTTSNINKEELNV